MFKAEPGISRALLFVNIRLLFWRDPLLEEDTLLKANCLLEANCLIDTNCLLEAKPFLEAKDMGFRVSGLLVGAPRALCLKQTLRQTSWEDF